MRLRAGFALPAVLAGVALLSLVMLAGLRALDGLGRTARSAGAEAAFAREALTAEAHALFLAYTEPSGPDRLRVGGSPDPRTIVPGERAWRLDGRGYRTGAGGRAVASLQDGAGLVELNHSRRDALLRLFRDTELGADASQTLADQLLDWIDTDAARRARGAESAEYLAAGRPPPANAPLPRIDGVWSLLDWPRAVDAARWRRMEAWLAADPISGAFNINTAPVPVLRIVLNLDDDRARALVRRRETAPFANLREAGLPSDSGGVSPNGRFRFRYADPGRGYAYDSWLRLTPSGAERPGWISERRTRRLTPEAADALKGIDAVLPDPFRGAAAG